MRTNKIYRLILIHINLMIEDLPRKRCCKIDIYLLQFNKFILNSDAKREKANIKANEMKIKITSIDEVQMIRKIRPTMNNIQTERIPRPFNIFISRM